MADGACRAFVEDSVVVECPRRLHSADVEPPRGREALQLPCRSEDPELWFAAMPADLERAKQLCAGCPVRQACLAVAVDRLEYTGVWGGHIIERGRIVPRKRPRGRPRKHVDTQEREAISDIAAVPAHGRTRMDTAARLLYDAERAVQVAHRTRTATVIDAANHRLHEAAAEYLAAALDARGEPDRRQSAS